MCVASAAHFFIFRRFGMKKITGFILASVLLLTVMCGCSPEKEKTAAQSDTAISTTTTTAVTTETTEESTTASTTVQTTHVPSTTQSTVHSTSRSAASTQRKRQQEHKTTVSTTKKPTSSSYSSKPNSSSSNGNSSSGSSSSGTHQHSMPVGNMGRWFTSRNDLISFYQGIVDSWNQKVNSGEITEDEFASKCPRGYECWSCSSCGKWTGNFKYDR